MEQYSGIIGAVVGSLIGIFGGAYGTYCSYKSAKTNSERKFVILFSLIIIFVVGIDLLLLFILPSSYSWIVFAVFPFWLFPLIFWGNIKLKQLRIK
ncbi:MAG: hypothetical protein HY606_09605 [Planctomycetes bacterium]|nr:hypothetical protein [Planctomycetota bacterium]